MFFRTAAAAPALLTSSPDGGLLKPELRRCAAAAPAPGRVAPLLHGQAAGVGAAPARPPRRAFWTPPNFHPSAVACQDRVCMNVSCAVRGCAKLPGTAPASRKFQHRPALQGRGRRLRRPGAARALEAAAGASCRAVTAGAGASGARARVRKAVGQNRFWWILGSQLCSKTD